MNLKKFSAIGLSIVVSSMIFTGCSGKPGRSSTTAPALSALEIVNNALGLSGVSILSSEQMTNLSDANISNNNHGLITPYKALGWINNWATTKPAVITGKLFIMQVGQVMPLDAAHNYIKHNDVDTFTFDRTDGCTSTDVVRFDGITNMPKPVFTGKEMDQAFAAYNIDPNKDMLLIMLGEDDGSNEYLAGVARMWYTMKYWGMDSTHVSIMDGSAVHEFNPVNNPNIATLDDIFVATESPYQMNGTVSIKAAKKDGTILQASMRDMMDLIDANSSNTLILDARSASEYAGTANSKTELLTCGINGTTQCLTAFEGHIKGAKNIQHKDLYNWQDQTIDVNGDGAIDMKDASYTFKSIATMAGMFATAGYTSGKDVYTYCRTGTKASLLSFVSNDVLGYKTRMFDGSWIQWGKMANVLNMNNAYMLDVNNSYRLDIPRYSEVITPRTDKTLVQPFLGTVNTNYTNTSTIILEDKRFKVLPAFIQ